MKNWFLLGFKITKYFSVVSTKIKKPIASQLRTSAITVIGIVLLSISNWANSTLITATPNVDFSGVIATTGFPTITFDDLGSTGTVKVKIDQTNLAPLATAFASDWWFNFSGDADDLIFGPFTKTGTFADPTIATCNNCTSPASFRPDGDGFFDIHLAFSTSSADRFDAGEILEFDITFGGIIANDFNHLSIAGPGDTSNDFHCVATHVQGLAGDGSDHLGASDCRTDGNGNGTVPTPTTLALFGLGLAGLGLARRKKA